MSEIEDLLAQIKTEYESEQQPQKSSSAKSKPHQEEQKASPLDNLLAEVKQEVEKQTTQPKSGSRSSFSSDRANNDHFRSPSEHNLISQIQQEFQERKKEEQQQQLKQQQRRRQDLEKQAQEWLKNLKPNSDEGVWFAEFSYAYQSKLEAAVDYLQAIRETRFLG